MKLTPELLGKRHSIMDAEHTYRIAAQAYGQGNLRLAVSRGITAVIQASIASMGALQEVKERADRVVQGVRRIIQGAVLKRAARRLSELGVLSGRRAKSPLPFWLEREVTRVKQKIADNQRTVDKAIIKAFLETEVQTIPSDLGPLNPDEAQPGEIVPPVEFEDRRSGVLKKMKGRPFLFESAEPLELHHLLSNFIDPSTMAITPEGVAVRPDMSVQAAITINKLFLSKMPKKREMADWLRRTLSQRTLAVMNKTLDNIKRKVINSMIKQEIERWEPPSEAEEVSRFMDPLRESIQLMSARAKQSLPKHLRDTLDIQKDPEVDRPF